MSEITYSVPGMSCDHCKPAVKSELCNTAGVEWSMSRRLDDAALIAAIEEARL